MNTRIESHPPPADELREQIRAALGEAPPHSRPRAPILLGESESDGFRLVEYAYVNDVGERIPMTVAEPAPRLHGPAVVAIHQTNECGRKEVFGLAGDPSVDYGRGLARRGHRVFAIDLAWTGERAPHRQWDKDEFYRQHPRWSMIGKAVRDVADLCQVMTEHFGEREPFGYVGHSLGGVVGFFFAALDGRISRLVCNAAYFHTPQEGHSSSAQLYTSQMVTVSPEGFCIASNFDLLVSLAAARADVLLFYYRGDTIVEGPSPSEVELRRMRAYSNRVCVFGVEGGHSFPRPAQEMSFAFLEGRPIGTDAPLCHVTTS